MAVNAITPADRAHRHAIVERRPEALLVRRAIAFFALHVVVDSVGRARAGHRARRSPVPGGDLARGPRDGGARLPPAATGSPGRRRRRARRAGAGRGRARDRGRPRRRSARGGLDRVPAPSARARPLRTGRRTALGLAQRRAVPLSPPRRSCARGRGRRVPRRDADRDLDPRHASTARGGRGRSISVDPTSGSRSGRRMVSIWPPGTCRPATARRWSPTRRARAPCPRRGCSSATATACSSSTPAATTGATATRTCSAGAESPTSTRRWRGSVGVRTCVGPGSAASASPSAVR